MKKIIHMSDLHLGYKDFGQRFYNIVDNLVEQKGKEAHKYIIVITGDLVDDANHSECYVEAQGALKALRDGGFGDILVIPGNHDYGTGDYGDKKFVQLFHEAFYDDDKIFPRKDIIDSIAFLGLDSLAEELNWHDAMFAEGEIGRDQLKRLKKALREDDVVACKKRVVYLHHHPFKWRPVHQLKDSHKLKKVLVEAMDHGISIDALLFGHNHQGNSHNGEWGIPRCYDAGTVTLKPRPKYLAWCKWFKINSSVRVIDIESDDVSRDYELDLH